MKRFFLLILGLFLVLNTNLSAQQVFNGDLYFYSQAQIDFFGLTNYTSITGRLIIDSGNSPGTGDITNLDSLHRLTSIGEELSIFNNANLTNINGLSNLTSVGALASSPADGQVSIVLNNSLTNINGLSNLEFIGGPLYIYDNGSLENIDGLQGLQNFAVFFQISGNAALTNINGLTNALNSIIGGIAIGGFSIFNNASLTSVAGLINVVSTFGNVNISNNPSLVNLNGLQNLQYIHGRLEISDNILITNLNELSNLELVAGTPFGGLIVTGNTALTNFEGFNTLALNCGLKRDYEFSDNGSSPPAALLERFDECLANNAPTADAGEDAEVVAGTLVYLNGTGSSDPDNDPLSYNWLLTNKPSGSNAVLSSNTDADPNFLADLVGIYIVRFIVNDGYVNSTADFITITAISVPDAIQNPLEDVQLLPLNAGNKNALISKLQNALDKYNEGNLIAARNQLHAFLNQLNQFVLDGKITASEAQPLIDYVNQIIAAINSSLPKAENEISEQLPEEFVLHQNYPNPFNPTTSISYQLPVSGHVSLMVYDLLGNEVVSLINEFKSAGKYSVKLDASGLSSGTYLYRLQAGESVQTKKLLLLK